MMNVKKQDITSGGVTVFAARGKHLCCRPHPRNQISNWYSYDYNDGISVDCEQYAKLGCNYVIQWNLGGSVAIANANANSPEAGQLKARLIEEFLKSVKNWK